MRSCEVDGSIVDGDDGGAGDEDSRRLDAAVPFFDSRNRSSARQNQHHEDGYGRIILNWRRSAWHERRKSNDQAAYQRISVPFFCRGLGIFFPSSLDVTSGQKMFTIGLAFTLELL